MTIQQAVINFKRLIETAIIAGGAKEKEAIIRSSLPILNIHEAVKTALIANGVNPILIYPPCGARTPELKLAGSMKQKNQDVCVRANDVPLFKTSLCGGLLNGVVDRFGDQCTERTLCINVRSQISSLQKNFDTLYERTISEALNLHDRSPKMCLGEVYMIAVPEYDNIAFDENRVAFKHINSRLVEKYIKSFQAINNRNVTDKFFYQYEHACLLIVDFSKDIPKIYNSTDELKADGLLAPGSTISMEGLQFDNFAQKLLSTYNQRFGEGKFR